MLYGIQSLYLYILRTTGEPPEVPNKTEPNVFFLVVSSLRPFGQSRVHVVAVGAG